MAKYTDEQIKKAMECCCETECKECPFRCGSAVCISNLMEAILDLINRQEAEKAELQRENCELKSKIERVRVEVAELNSNLILLRNDYEQCRSSYEEYKAKVAILNDKLITAYKLLKSAKSEAIKEFAERLKARTTTIFWRVNEDTREITHPFVDVNEIDNLVEEMVGE